MKRHKWIGPAATAAIAAIVAGGALGGDAAARVPDIAQQQSIHVDLSYGAPGNGPAPNFSPKGTQVQLTALASGDTLPPGAARPAKAGVIKVGPDKSAWIPVLATATPDHPDDLCQIFVDRNRNGSFADDGAGLAAKPAQNEKTKAWWSSINGVQFTVPYPAGAVEPYLVDVWIVRDDGAPAPDLLRYSVRSWRFGRATVNGIEALVAAMDGDNDAVWTKEDSWSVIEASAPDATKAVLSHTEARPTSRLMFVKDAARELVLEFRNFSPDGRSMDFAVVDRPATKAADRAADDTLAVERNRPRTGVPFAWRHDFNAALAAAKSAGGRRVFIDFETTWCGPCKSMDDWIWTDADVAALLNAGYVGLKLDGDVEKALVKRYAVAGYPTMIVVDAAGREVKRAVGYQSSKEMIAFLTAIK